MICRLVPPVVLYGLIAPGSVPRFMGNVPPASGTSEEPAPPPPHPPSRLPIAVIDRTTRYVCFMSRTLGCSRELLDEFRCCSVKLRRCYDNVKSHFLEVAPRLIHPMTLVSPAVR